MEFNSKTSQYHHEDTTEPGRIWAQALNTLQKHVQAAPRAAWLGTCRWKSGLLTLHWGAAVKRVCRQLKWAQLSVYRCGSWELLDHLHYLSCLRRGWEASRTCQQGSRILRFQDLGKVNTQKCLQGRRKIRKRDSCVCGSEPFSSEQLHLTANSYR